MNEPRAFNDETWDRFFNFLYTPEKPLTPAEIKAELKRLGIDAKPAQLKVQQALRTAQAREQLEAARRERPDAVAAIRQMAMSGVASAQESIDSIKEKIRQLLDAPGSEQMRPVYMRKLEGAASDDDLRSMLEDLERLKHLPKGPSDGPAKT